MEQKNALLRTVSALLVGLACIVSGPAAATPYSSLYVFGDSLSDNGNDALLTLGLVPNVGIYTDGSNIGRFTNGLNYADRLAADLGLPLAPSLLGGTNYAYGGARTSYGNADLTPLGALSFNQQLAAFYGTHASTDSGGLYVLWIGANDMADAISAFLLAPQQATIDVFVLNAMLGIADAIGGIAVRGGEHFLVPNIPDLSLTPAIRAFNDPVLSALASGVSQYFNQNLVALLDNAVFDPLDIRTMDVFAMQTAITQDPGAFGYTDVSQACYNGDVTGLPLPLGPQILTVCANPDNFLYFDFEHPTAALHRNLANLALQAVPEPATAPLLLLALICLGAGRVRRAVPPALLPA